MRFYFAGFAWALALAAVPAQGTKIHIPYKIVFDPQQDVAQLDRFDGKDGLFLSVKFIITLNGAQVDELGKDAGKNYKLRIEENGKFVKAVDVPQPKPSEDLAVVLAMDISGSMKEHERMQQARRASGVFFDSLPAKAECGLILFNHRIDASLPLSGNRGPLRKMIDAAQPHGGTAYFDAAEKAIAMLEHSPIKARAVVLMTDGVDINSDSTLERVVARAKNAKVRIYTIGIGQPGRQDRVTSVLVLDKSGSMNLPANDQDKASKIQALRDAADRFVNSIGSTRQSTILEFSDAVQMPKPFTNNKFALKGTIKNIYAQGETALFDAVYTAVAILDADPEAGGGKRAVIALTDGIDNSSRRRVEEVINRAKEANIPLYMLGFGRKGELDVKTMERMAQETKGQFYHAENEQALIQLFEDLSIKLHDDGIDEISLGTLAAQTGGKYYPAQNVSKLDFVLQQVTKNIQRKDYQITFPSLLQVRDGTRRRVTLKLVRNTGGTADHGGGEVLITKEGGAQVHGLVIAEMHPLVYLILLAILSVLIALPGMLKRRTT